MIDFEITQDKFASAARMMTKAHTSLSGELVDLTCYTENIKFVVTGREFTCSARVELKGLAQFPLDLLPKIQKAAATFGEKPLRFRIEDGRIRINSVAISMPAIVVRKSTDRPIDIPDDASDRDLLALLHLFTDSEVAASDLAKRFLVARSRKLKAIGSAGQTLAEYGIPAQTLESLVNESLKVHAETLRPLLKPALISDRPN